MYNLLLLRIMYHQQKSNKFNAAFPKIRFFTNLTEVDWFINIIVLYIYIIKLRLIQSESPVIVIEMYGIQSVVLAGFDRIVQHVFAGSIW